MPESVRISAPIPASATSDRADASLVSTALFSGIGLLISLVAILIGVPVAWY